MISGDTAQGIGLINLSLGFRPGQMQADLCHSYSPYGTDKFSHYKDKSNSMPCFNLKHFGNVASFDSKLKSATKLHIFYFVRPCKPKATPMCLS